MTKLDFNVVKNLRRPINFAVFFGVSVIAFDFNYYLLTHLPKSFNKMCVPPGDVAPLELLFIVMISLLTGIMISTIIDLVKMKTAGRASTSFLGSVGLFLGTLTVFCPYCTLPFITLFGLSVSLQFFVTYGVIIRILSVLLMLGALVLVDQQLSGECITCNINNKSCKNE